MQDIGSRKQLLFDDRFVADARGVTRTMHSAMQHPAPVLIADRPWEARGIGGYNTVLREPDGRFRMWYAAQTLGGLPQEGAGRLCYAESKDGIHWEKPALGLLPFRGERQTNIVAPPLERQSLQGGTIYRDDRAPAEERYKLLTKFRATNAELAAGARNGLYAMHSPDGLRWRLYPNQPCSDVMCDTQNMFFWDERLDLYAAYTRVRETQHLDEAFKAAGRKGYRTVGRMTSPDFRTWSAQQIVLEADAADLNVPSPAPFDALRPRVDFYTNCAMKYQDAQDVYLMFPSAYYHWGENDFPAMMDVQLLASRDGIHWERQGGRAPFLRKGLDGSASGGMIFANPWLIPMGDELWLYYAGTERTHGSDAPGAKTGIFRATMRRDGFVSLDAGRAPGGFTTPPFTFQGSGLELNFDGGAGGWAQVEMQDAEGRPLPGRGLGDCDALVGNSIRRRVSWRGSAAVGDTAGRPVRLRFVLCSARLYAFQFRAQE